MEMYTQRIEAQAKTIETTDNNTVPKTVVVVMKLSLKNTSIKIEMLITILMIGYVNDVKSV